MNERPRPADPRKLQPKDISNFDAFHSQKVDHLFNKIKKTFSQKHEHTNDELPKRQRDIRMAIEMRFNRSKANKEYVYRFEDDSLDISHESTHSSEMEEYQHLRTTRFVSLHDQNKRQKKIGMQKYESLKTGMKKFKINNNSSGIIRKTEGDEIEQKRIHSNDKTVSKNDSPFNFISKYLFKSNKPNKHKEKRKVNLSEESAKYRTLGGPFLEKSNEYVRYAHKMVKSKQQLSRDSSTSQKSQLLKSNLTLQVEFKKKYNSNNTSSMHYQNISSSTRIGSVPKTQPEKGRAKVVSTSSSKLQKINDRLIKLLFSNKRI